MPNSHTVKILCGGGHHIEFWETSISTALVKIFATIWWEPASPGHMEVTTLPKWNRKLIPVTSSYKFLGVNRKHTKNFFLMIPYRKVHTAYCRLVRCLCKSHPTATDGAQRRHSSRRRHWQVRPHHAGSS